VHRAWIQSPDIVGVIVIKIEEYGDRQKLPKGWKPTTPLLTKEQWFQMKWSGPEIKHDGICWMGEHYYKFLVFLNKAHVQVFCFPHLDEYFLTWFS
jgi:hypothetical protein